MHDPLTKTKTITPETVQDITNQAMKSSGRRRYKATLAAVAAFTAICQRVRAAVAWVAVLELLDLEDGEGTDGDDPHTRLTRTVVPRPDYKQTPWPNMLRNQDLVDPTSRAGKFFRRRFHVPHMFSSRWCVGSLRRECRRSAVHPCDAQSKQLYPVLAKC